MKDLHQAMQKVREENAERIAELLKVREDRTMTELHQAIQKERQKSTERTEALLKARKPFVRPKSKPKGNL